MTKIYNLRRKQVLPIGIEEAWKFFSSPHNLKNITPAYMNFDISYISGGNEMYPGQIISYQLQPVAGLPVSWTTEITHVNKPNYFVDEQRFGPYTLWHHQHRFRVVEGGVEMEDEVNYAIPLGIVGRFANWLFVNRQVKAIFDHRYKILETYFEVKSEV